MGKTRMIMLVVTVCLSFHSLNAQTMATDDTKKQDLAQLSKLNALFIQNFLNQDVPSHSAIIHNDFVCIQSSGLIVGREEYLKAWADAYTAAGYQSFEYTDELIRIFGNIALVRSRTNYTKLDNGKVIKGSSIYTDTYMKENGEWKCVQAQITPVK